MCGYRMEARRRPALPPLDDALSVVKLLLLLPQRPLGTCCCTGPTGRTTWADDTVSEPTQSFVMSARGVRPLGALLLLGLGGALRSWVPGCCPLPGSPCTACCCPKGFKFSLSSMNTASGCVRPLLAGPDMPQAANNNVRCGASLATWLFISAYY